MQALQPLPSNARLGQVAVNGVEIAFLEMLPAVERGIAVLLHGFTASKDSFLQMAEELARLGFRVLALDHRGQGQSSHADPTTYTLEQLAQDANAVAEALDLRESHLLGHSFGGLVARAAVLQQPGRWKSLTFFCSGPGQLDPYEPALLRLESLLAKKTMAETWQFLCTNPDYEVPVQVDPQVGSMRELRWHLADRQSVLAQANILRTAADHTSELAQIGLPIHVFFGELDDAWPLIEQRNMGAKLAAVITEMPGVGHCPNDEEPIATAGLLAKYWSAQ